MPEPGGPVLNSSSVVADPFPPRRLVCSEVILVPPRDCFACAGAERACDSQLCRTIKGLSEKALDSIPEVRTVVTWSIMGPADQNHFEAQETIYGQAGPWPVAVFQLYEQDAIAAPTSGDGPWTTNPEEDARLGDPDGRPIVWTRIAIPPGEGAVDFVVEKMDAAMYTF